MTISRILFDEQFSAFERRIAEKSGEAFHSFDKGWVEEEEGYKREIHRVARIKLSTDRWRKKSIGSGEILERVRSAIEIDEPGVDLRNNLVQWQPKWGPEQRGHKAILNAATEPGTRRAYETWFWDFFKDNAEPSFAFERFRDMAGNRYDLIAYLFFLRDRDNFMPIAPTTFDKAFARLGVDLVTSRHCSWENYSAYVQTLREVQTALQDLAHVPNAQLLDAHSFCYILGRTEIPIRKRPSIDPPILIADGRPWQSSGRSSPAEDFVVVPEEEFIKGEENRRRIGRLAQEIALESEITRLTDSGHPDAEALVKPVWGEVGRGYDILSAELTGEARHIEVKAARYADRRFSFFLSRNEWETSRNLPNYFFYLVRGVESGHPSVFAIDGNLISADCLDPQQYVVRIEKS